MPIVTYMTTDGGQYEFEVPNGSSVMEGAVNNGVDGIVAECGGACTCGTCHCYIDDAWLTKLDEPGEFEKDLLAIVIDPQPNSRLACQIKINDSVDGLVVWLPKAQI